VTDATLETLKRLATHRFGPRAEKLSVDDDLFEVLGIDSLQALDLLTDLETEFKVQIPDWELQGVNTLRGLADVVGSKR
jgi:acyl carrier protein